jgi:uncharacterized protein with FMN-binding domain
MTTTCRPPAHRRLRRLGALTGILASIGGAVGVRAAVTPPPSQALGSSSLAAPVNRPASRAPHAPTRPRHASAAAPRRRQVVGGAFDVSYGVVQVRVTLRGTRITDVSTVSLPRGGRSSDISSYAAPQLRREALSAQSAHIDTVSGASYTSAGYAESLQSALDKAAR